MSALDEKTKAERALKDLQRTQGEQKVLLLKYFSLLLSISFILSLLFIFDFCHLHAYDRHAMICMVCMNLNELYRCCFAMLWQ